VFTDVFEEYAISIFREEEETWFCKDLPNFNSSAAFVVMIKTNKNRMDKTM
jgi:hypothetical protein